MKNIIKIQAYYRGYRVRSMTETIQNANNSKKKYFNDNEYWETISKK